jgi:hypothetical protein
MKIDVVRQRGAIPEVRGLVNVSRVLKSTTMSE